MEQANQIMLKKPHPRSEKQRELLRILNEELTKCFLNSGQAYDENKLRLFYFEFEQREPKAVRKAFEGHRQVSRFVPAISDISQRIESFGYSASPDLGPVVREWVEDGILWRRYEKHEPWQKQFVRWQAASEPRDARRMEHGDRKSEDAR